MGVGLVKINAKPASTKVKVEVEAELGKKKLTKNVQQKS